MRSTRTYFVFAALGLAALACSSSSTPSDAGGTGGTGGSGGSGGTGGADAGSSAFMAVAPCNAATDYMTGSMITFPVSDSVLKYSPQCLKVTAGTSVTWKGDFSMHPLQPSTKRGTTTGNPIMSTSSDMMKSFTFSTPGFYGFYCQYHDPIDTGTLMSGVVWVTP